MKEELNMIDYVLYRNQETKAEAEKIIQEFYDILADQTTNLDCWEIAKRCAIIHVKGIIKEMDMVKSEINPQWDRWKHWQSILTELER